jgi:hypothetical protein
MKRAIAQLVIPAPIKWIVHVVANFL